MPATCNLSSRHLQPLLRISASTKFAPCSCTRLPFRPVSVVHSYRKGLSSVSFGQQTDELIESYTRGGRARSKSKGAKSTRKDSGSTTLDTGSIEISLDGDNEAILATKAPPFNAETLSPSSEQSSRNPTRGDMQIGSSTRVSEVVKKMKSPSDSKRKQEAELKRRDNIGEPSRVPKPAQLPRNAEQWQVQKHALKTKFGESGWKPRKRLSPDAVEGLRQLHVEDPLRYSTPVLAEQFKVSPEAIRRILKSKWKPNTEEMEDRRQRWARRHDRIWDQKAALGLRPPRRREREPEGPEAFDEELRAKQLLGQI